MGVNRIRTKVVVSETKVVRGDNCATNYAEIINWRTANDGSCHLEKVAGTSR